MLVDVMTFGHQMTPYIRASRQYLCVLVPEQRIQASTLLRPHCGQSISRHPSRSTYPLPLQVLQGSLPVALHLRQGTYPIRRDYSMATPDASGIGTYPGDRRSLRPALAVRTGTSPDHACDRRAGPREYRYLRSQAYPNLPSGRKSRLAGPRLLGPSAVPLPRE